MPSLLSQSVTSTLFQLCAKGHLSFSRKHTLVDSNIISGDSIAVPAEIKTMILISSVGVALVGRYPHKEYLVS